MKVPQLNPNNSNLIYYSIRERIAIGILARSYGWNITHLSNQDSYDKYDVVFTSGGTMFLGEVKMRKHSSTDFNDWILEKNKWSALNELVSGEQAIKNNLQPLYITILRDKIVMWDVSTITEDRFSTEFLRAVSVNNDERKKDKEIVKLTIDEAKYVIDYSIDIDKVNSDAFTVMQYQYPNAEVKLV